MRRRDFGRLAGSGLLGALVGRPVAAGAPASPARWSNWSGLESCSPQRIAAPASEDELAALLRGTTGPVRFAGAGHSFTALVPTAGTLVTLDALNGVVRHDRSAARAVVRAGTRIAVLAPALDAIDLALPNQPDVSVQSLGGSFATATHGTGARLPALHAQIVALRLVTADGRVIAASRERERDLFDAARVSLGALGALSEVELQLQPRFHLKRRVWTQRVQTLLGDAAALAAAHRHFEMFLLPHTGYGAGVVHDEVASGAPLRIVSEEEETLDDLRKLRDWLGGLPGLRRWVAGTFIGEREEIERDLSWRLLSNTRSARFNESEWHVPAARGLDCLAEVLAAIERHHEAYYPIEFRHVAADDAWLSPFHGRDACSIAVHAAAGEDHAYLVRDLGPIFRRHGGRPHWGKLHDMGPAELAAVYPRWQDFLALRRELDPQGRLLNPYLQRLFGASAHA